MEKQLQIFNNWYEILDEKTENISADILKKILDGYRTFKYEIYSNIVVSNNDELCDISIKICDRLILHMREGFGNLEDQVLCSTCLCSLINILPNGYHTIYTKDVHDLLIQYLDINDDFETESNDFNTYKTIIKKRNTIALINGLFKCDLILNEYTSKNSSMKQLSLISIHKSLEIIIRSCMKYSSSTFFSFKTFLIIVEKFVQWNIDMEVVNDLHESILFVIFHNWENLYPGVKDINSKIFRCYLKVVDNLSIELTHSFIDKPWSKTKYHVMCEIILESKSANMLSEDIYISCMQGLKYSLENPLMMSVGKDLYKAILQSFSVHEEWQRFFSDIFIQYLSGNNQMIKVNVLNHWLPLTIKTFPNILEMLINDLKKTAVADSLFALLFILKLGRKSGLIMVDFYADDEKNIFIKKIMELGLYHINSDIRNQTFEILCCSPKTTVMPNAEELSLVKTFLIQNITEDSAVFRMNTLNGFISLIIRLRDTFLYTSKQNNEEYSESMEIFQFFFESLHSILLENLNFGGNYQRKILTLKILDVILKHFSQPSKKSISSPRIGKNRKEQGWEVKIYLKKKGKWLFDDDHTVNALVDNIADSSNDVRELATDILINYYIENDHLVSRRKELFVSSIINCTSTVGFEVESGLLFLKLILNFSQELTVEEVGISIPNPKKFKSEIFEYLCIKSWENLDYNESDSLFSICNNQVLHGLLSALSLCVKRYSKDLNNSNIVYLLALLDESVHFCFKSLSYSCKGKEINYSPSFAEMTESIKMLISRSSYEYSDDQNSTHITNSEKLVLNNIWLNLKASGELASTIVETCYSVLTDRDIENCININISILMRCRHKGAIEAAGLNLGRAVRHITLSDDELRKEMLLSILEKFLEQILSNDTSGASVTRRSAGLAILVHRFVASDSRKQKPYFTLVFVKLIKYLLAQLVDQKLCLLNNIPSHVEGDTKYDDILDIPHARAIHLLCRAVNDSSLSQDVIQFASQLSALCFEYIIEEQWQLRNAALQLYGALVPRLIGRKGKENDENLSESSMTVDELFSHLPRLWRLLDALLDTNVINNEQKDKFRAHTNLVPILNLLSNTAKRNSMNFNIVNTHVCSLNIEFFFEKFTNLLESPLHTVRISVAKIIYLFYEINTFHDYIEKNIPQNANKLHGCLLVLQNHLTYFNSVEKYSTKRYIGNFNQCFDSILRNLGKLKQINCSYLINSLYLEILYKFNRNSQVDYLSIMTRVHKVYENSNEIEHLTIGYHRWINLNLSMVISNSSNEMSVKVINFCILNFDLLFLSEAFWNVLIKRFKKVVPNNIDLLNNILTIFEKNSSESDFSKINFEVLYRLLKSIQLSNIVCCDRLFENSFNIFKKRYEKSNCSYIIPFLSVVLSKKCIHNNNAENIQNAQHLLYIMRKLLKSDQCNVEIKTEIVIGLKYFVNIITCLCEKKYRNNDQIFKFKSEVFSSIFWLLQDEDVTVRYKTAKIKYFNRLYTTFPHNSLILLLSREFLFELFNNAKILAIQFLEILIQEIPLKKIKESFEILNIFDNEVKNIYLECDFIKDRIILAINSFK